MYAHTKVIRAGILAALQEGEGTMKEIQARMGIAITSLDRHMRQLVHEGAIRKVGKKLASVEKGGAKAVVYALTEAGKVAA